MRYREAAVSDVRTPSTVGATYVEPSATEVLEPGRKIGDLLRRNMTQPFVLQRLSERAWWVLSVPRSELFGR